MKSILFPFLIFLKPSPSKRASLHYFTRKKFTSDLINYCHLSIFCHITFSMEILRNKHELCGFGYKKWAKPLINVWCLPLTKIRNGQGQNPVTYTFKFVSWKIVNSYSPWLQKCISLRNSYSLSLRKLKTNLTHFEQCQR